MSTLAPAKFFIPHVKPRASEADYESILASVKYQFNWPVTTRRISSLSYTRDKKLVTARIGEHLPFEHKFEVVAILESNLYLIITRSEGGHPGPTILVDTKEVTESTEFTPPVASV